MWLHNWLPNNKPQDFTCNHRDQTCGESDILTPFVLYCATTSTMRLSVDLSGVCPLPLNSMDWSRNHNIQPRVHVLCQHHLENYFGQQRARGGWCNNPTMADCLHSAQSLRVQHSFPLQPVRGNCSKKRKLFSAIDDTPLPKKPRKPKK